MTENRNLYNNQVQSDWLMTDPNDPAFILNKPAFGTVNSVDAIATGVLSFTGGPITNIGVLDLNWIGTNTQVVLGDGTTIPIPVDTNFAKNDLTFTGNRFHNLNFFNLSLLNGGLIRLVSGNTSLESSVSIKSNVNTNSGIEIINNLVTLFSDVPSGHIAIRSKGLGSNTGLAYLNTGIISSNRTFNFPDRDGILPLSVNGNLADTLGNISLSLTTGTVTSVNALIPFGNSLTVTGGPITNSGVFNFNWNGNPSQYINGAGNLVFFPTIPSVPVVNDATLTMQTTGIAVGSATFTANSSIDTTFSVDVPGTNLANNIIGNNVTILSSTGSSTTFAFPAAGTGTVTSVNSNITNGNALSTSGGPITVSGTLGFTWLGNSSQYINGLGDLVTFPNYSPVNLIEGSNITITGTYPNLTLSSQGSVFSIAAGDGMNFSTITGSGDIIMGQPSDITLSSANLASGTTHSHKFAPGGTSVQYITGDGSLSLFPTIPSQVNLINGTGISITGSYPNLTVTNTLPDQTVVLTGTGGITTSGTYPNFTINSGVVNNGTLSLGTTGIATGSATFTANQATGSTFTVNVPATNIGSSILGNVITLTSSTGTGTTITLPNTDTNFALNNLTFNANRVHDINTFDLTLDNAGTITLNAGNEVNVGSSLSVSDIVTIDSLSGIGTRIVVADPVGVLGVQTFPNDTNFAITDLTFTASRTHDMNSFDLVIDNGNAMLLSTTNNILLDCVNAGIQLGFSGNINLTANSSTVDFSTNGTGLSIQVDANNATTNKNQSFQDYTGQIESLMTGTPTITFVNCSGSATITGTAKFGIINFTSTITGIGSGASVKVTYPTPYHTLAVAHVQANLSMNNADIIRVESTSTSEFYIFFSGGGTTITSVSSCSYIVNGY